MRRQTEQMSLCRYCRPQQSSPRDDGILQVWCENNVTGGGKGRVAGARQEGAVRQAGISDLAPSYAQASRTIHAVVDDQGEVSCDRNARVLLEKTLLGGVGDLCAFSEAREETRAGGSIVLAVNHELVDRD